MKGIIYYTDNRLTEPLRSLVIKQIARTGFYVVSTSLKPIEFGENVVVEGERGYPTMIKQITTALATSTAKYVFFCEHDVLYPRSHFDFVPPRDDIFYYNVNVWRWGLGNKTVIRHNRMMCLSCLCVNREFALDHYQKRMERILEVGLDKFTSREPELARIWGYEPGTKKTKRGGFSNDDYATWESEEPVIDVRHKGSFSSPKLSLQAFTHPPEWFKEIPIEQVKGWNLKEMFAL